MKYAALLRGINVGGNHIIKMAELRDCLEIADFNNVQTYIQSGNVIFESSDNDKVSLTKKLEQTINKQFGLTIPTVILSQKELETIVSELPKNWNSKTDWKYNYLFLKQPYNITEVVASIGELKPNIEELVAGKGVLYQSLLFSKYGRTTTGKIASLPVYKIMTIRNHNTVTKLLAKMREL